MDKLRLHPIPLIPILFLIFMSGTIFIPSTLCSAQGLQNDANSGGDAGDQITGAIPIEQGVYEGVLFDSTDMRDFYQLDLTINSTMKITLLDNFNSLSMSLYNSKNKSVQNSYNLPSGIGTLHYCSPMNESYFLLVYSVQGSWSYRIDISIVNQNDFDQRGDLPDTIGFTPSFPLPLTRMGVLESQGDPADVFRVYLQRGWYIQLEITPSSQNDFDLAVYKPNSDLMYEGTTYGNKIERLSFLAFIEGDHFFTIYLPLTQSNVSGTYIVSMKILETISLPSNPTSSSGLTNSPGGSLFDFLDFIPFKEVLLVIILLAAVVVLLKK